MEKEDEAVLSEVKLETDIAEEPAENWTTQQWTQGQCCFSKIGRPTAQNVI
jgi:hypothetical protein